MRHIILATICIAAAQTASPLSLISETETMRRIKLAGQNNDRSEMPFLEATALSETSQELDRVDAARAYIHLATLDESAEFMRRHFFTERRYALGGSRTMIKFLEKSAADEKDVDDATRERLYTFLLEVMQTCESSVDANRSDLFLLERVPGYADSKQRAALTRYANTGNDWVTNTFNPIKEHFDTLPPSKLVDLRTRFPTLPPPPGETPSPRVWPYAIATLAALAIAIAIILRKAMKRSKETHE